MVKFRNKVFVAVIISMFMFFGAQAQVEDTTYQETPSEAETAIPQTETSTEMQIEPAVQDTAGKFAAHFRLAEEMTERLSQTITLSEDQKNDITERIVKFQEEVADVNMEMKKEGESAETQEDLDEELISLVNDIEGMLDDSQKAEWIKSRNDWMGEVKAHIHSERDVKRQERQNLE